MIHGQEGIGKDSCQKECNAFTRGSVCCMCHECKGKLKRAGVQGKVSSKCYCHFDGGQCKAIFDETTDDENKEGEKGNKILTEHGALFTRKGLTTTSLTVDEKNIQSKFRCMKEKKKDNSANTEGKLNYAS